MELSKANNKAMIAKKAGISSKVGDGILFLNDSISKFLKSCQNTQNRCFVFILCSVRNKVYANE